MLQNDENDLAKSFRDDILNAMNKKDLQLEQHIATVMDAKAEETVHMYMLRTSGLSDKVITTMFHHHMIGINQSCAKKVTPIHNGDLLDYKIPDPRPKTDEPEDIPLDFIYEDNDLLVLNKQKGLACQSGPGNWSHTLTNALLYYQKTVLQSAEHLKLVHRLDMDTSGCLLIAKNQSAAASLSKQIQDKVCHRTYTALAAGIISEDCVIDQPIGRDPENFRQMAVSGTDAKPAVTHVRVLEKFEKATLIECSLETGRTHQIRVHLKSIGHPLIGDEIYGSDCEWLDTKGQVLHASKISFIQPDSLERITVEAPLPEYFQTLLALLRKSEKAVKSYPI